MALKRNTQNAGSRTQNWNFKTQLQNAHPIRIRLGPKRIQNALSTRKAPTTNNYNKNSPKRKNAPKTRSQNAKTQNAERKTQNSVGPYGPVYTRMGPYGPVWTCMGPYGPYGPDGRMDRRFQNAKPKRTSTTQNTLPKRKTKTLGFKNAGLKKKRGVWVVKTRF